jgi:hypothetical protein
MMAPDDLWAAAVRQSRIVDAHGDQSGSEMAGLTNDF